MKDREIFSGSNMWSAAQRLKKIFGFDVHVTYEENY